MHQSIPKPRSWGAVRREALTVLADILTCAYCEKEGTKDAGPDGRPWSIDHVFPTHFGGSDEMWNLVKACHRCNSRKHTQTGPEWTPNDHVMTAAGLPFGAFFADHRENNPIVAQLEVQVKRQQAQIKELEEMLWDAHHALRSIGTIADGLTDQRGNLQYDPSLNGVQQ